MKHNSRHIGGGYDRIRGFDPIHHSQHDGWNGLTKLFFLTRKSTYNHEIPCHSSVRLLPWRSRKVFLVLGMGCQPPLVSQLLTLPKQEQLTTTTGKPAWPFDKSKAKAVTTHSRTQAPVIQPRTQADVLPTGQPASHGLTYIARKHGESLVD